MNSRQQATNARRVNYGKLELSHCEQSWEGDASSPASPDTGLEHRSLIRGSLGREMLRVAHGRRDGKPRRLANTSFLLLVHFLCLNIPTGNLGIRSGKS